ncbi:hypothetical protein [Alkalibacterium pelagium]|uniref:Uncharacterized protein n=1 Tax=Alkalibacterium pelagium TaxID=426702 RepID=A0A1H7JFD2_9LACT|nr:hypothetical protein [Alkalibacterium pelagium]GEN50176.1 hypothetical protein APE02nite_08410 [Alkalibacterium pelagium]SEK72670.1 hypothetical protein SAMN04488099_105149 [Alkalibacterium pelagium]
MKLYKTFLTKRFVFFSLFSALLLAGCGSNDLFGDDAENVASIEVRDYDSDEFITTITDSSFIDSLVEELETADTGSTANMDLMNPEYTALFLDSEEQVIQSFGYYVDELSLGVVGRYHSRELGALLAVTTELPIE